jgi:hypothetical protein
VVWPTAGLAGADVSWTGGKFINANDRGRVVEHLAIPAGEDISRVELQVNLLSRAYRVHPDYQKMSAEQKGVYDEIIQGAGTTAAPFVPQAGYLTSASFANLKREPLPNLPEWPPELAAYDLVAIDDEGVWVEEDDLALLWQIVNQGVLVNWQGESYYIMLQIPDLSCNEPPKITH